jgi:hypothetical protein
MTTYRIEYATNDNPSGYIDIAASSGDEALAVFNQGEYAAIEIYSCDLLPLSN